MNSILKLLCYLLLTAFIHPNAHKSAMIETQDKIIQSTINNQFTNAKSAISQDVINKILEDKDNRVAEDFKIVDYFKNATYFWFSIYSQFTSEQVVIHDKDNLSIVYKVLDFSELHQSNINKYSKAKLQSDLSLEYAKKVKAVLTKLQSNNTKLSDEEKGIYSAITNSIKIPKNRNEKINLFQKLSNNIRTQTGQRDMIHDAILRSLPYLDTIYSLMSDFQLPKELISIAFIESSFNYRAQSYAGAVGVWQFMSWTSKSFLPPINNYVDYRKNIIISSLAAFHLLKQNIQILKRWDLAIPAYNFGPTKIQKFRLNYKGTTTLPIFLENTTDKAIGFASNNYFSEFLALSHVLAYKNKIFNLEGYAKKVSKFNKDNLAIYVTKCNLKPELFFNLLSGSSSLIKDLNTHFLKPNSVLKRGQLVVSDISLTNKKYYKITKDKLIKLSPKNFGKLASNYKCQ